MSARIAYAILILGCVAGMMQVSDIDAAGSSEAKKDSPLTALKEGICGFLSEKPFEIDKKNIKAVSEDGDNMYIKYKEREFLIYNYTPLQGYAEKPHKVEAPKHDGIIIFLSIRDGRYAGARKLPMSSQRECWAEFGDAKGYDEGGKPKHLLVVIQYGRKIGLKKIAALKQKIFDSFKK
jgi:hypothetical protein